MPAEREREDQAEEDRSQPRLHDEWTIKARVGLGGFHNIMRE